MKPSPSDQQQSATEVRSGTVIGRHPPRSDPHDHLSLFPLFFFSHSSVCVCVFPANLHFCFIIRSFVRVCVSVFSITSFGRSSCLACFSHRFHHHSRRRRSSTTSGFTCVCVVLRTSNKVFDLYITFFAQPPANTTRVDWFLCVWKRTGGRLRRRLRLCVLFISSSQAPISLDNLQVGEIIWKKKV